LFGGSTGDTFPTCLSAGRFGLVYLERSRKVFLSKKTYIYI